MIKEVYPKAFKTLCILFLFLSIYGNSMAVPESAPVNDSEKEVVFWGGNAQRNNVYSGTRDQEKNVPEVWSLGELDFHTGAWKSSGSKNIQWVTSIGTESYATPIISGDKLFVSTNNGHNHAKDFKEGTDLGLLQCLDVKSGKRLWVYASEKLELGTAYDWANQGICSNPVVEGDYLWILTNRCEMVCLNTAKYKDGEKNTPVWTLDLIKLGVRPHNMTCNTPVIVGDILLFGTSNGVDERRHAGAENADAPSFMALNKRTGEILWQDNTPGKRILHGHWGSPAVGYFGKEDVQVIFPGPDGWLYSFRPEADKAGNPQLLWKYDCNLKKTQWRQDGNCDRNSLVSTPVISGNYVYIATGEDPEHGEGLGTLWCIRTDKRGDVSSELVMTRDGKLAEPRRDKACDEKLGEKVIPNPNSAMVWSYRGAPREDDSEPEFEQTLHRSVSMVTVKDGLVILPDHAGLIHCLDAATGKMCWSYDMMAQVWGSALIVGNLIYVGDQDGDVTIIELSRDLKVRQENNVHNAVYGTLVYKAGVLYISTRGHVIAVRQTQE